MALGAADTALSLNLTVQNVINLFTFFGLPVLLM